MNNPFKLLFKFPSRERPERFFEGMDSIYRNLSDLDNFHVCATLDDDDTSMNNPEVIEKIASYKNTSIAWGKSESKIHAINRDIPDYDFDILIVWSDDMRAYMFGFDDLFRQYINFAFPDFDGLFHAPDQDAKDAVNVLYVATRKYYDRFGYIYHPSYLSLFADNETMDVAKILGKYSYCGVGGLFLHLNPAYGHLPRDPLFDRQQGLWEQDEKNYNARKLINFGL